MIRNYTFFKQNGYLIWFSHLNNKSSLIDLIFLATLTYSNTYKLQWAMSMHKMNYVLLLRLLLFLKKYYFPYSTMNSNYASRISQLGMVWCLCILLSKEYMLKKDSDIQLLKMIYIILICENWSYYIIVNCLKNK